MDDRLRRAAATLEEKKRRLEDLRRRTGTAGSAPTAGVRAATGPEKAAASVTVEGSIGSTVAADGAGVLPRASVSTAATLDSYISHLATAAEAAGVGDARRAAALEDAHAVSSVAYAPTHDDSFTASVSATDTPAPENTLQLASFLSRASRLVQRALAQSDYVDLEPAYIRPTQQLPDTDVAHDGASDLRVSNSVSRAATHVPPDATAAVLCCAVSPSFPELIAAAYAPTPLNATCAELSQPANICRVWHNRLSGAQAQLQAPGPLTALSWGAAVGLDESMLLAGCTTGEIVGWDIRSSLTVPSTRSGVTPTSHHTPLLNVFGTGGSTAGQNVATMITVSDDGRLCTWDTRRLQSPISTLQIGRGTRWEKSARLTAANWCSETDGSLVFGTSSGTLLTTGPYGRQEGALRPAAYGQHSPSPTGTMACLCAEIASESPHPHGGGIVGVNAHAASSSVTSAVLSASEDATVVLWSVQAGVASALLEFPDFLDCCTCVAWSPAHAATFAAADAAGRVLCYDLAADPYSPVASIQCTEAVVSLTWASDGSHLWLGDAAGKLHSIRLASASFAPAAAMPLSRLLQPWPSISLLR